MPPKVYTRASLCLNRNKVHLRYAERPEEGDGKCFQNRLWNHIKDSESKLTIYIDKELRKYFRCYLD